MGVCVGVVVMPGLRWGDGLAEVELGQRRRVERGAHLGLERRLGTRRRHHAGDEGAVVPARERARHLPSAGDGGHRRDDGALSAKPARAQQGGSVIVAQIERRWVEMRSEQRVGGHGATVQLLSGVCVGGGGKKRTN